MQRNPAPPRPSIERSHVRNQGRVALQQTEHGRDCTTGSIETAVLGEKRPMRFEPNVESCRDALILTDRLIAGEDGLPVASDGACIGGIVWERGRVTQSFARSPSPRKENASTSASSIHWQGLRGSAFVSQLLQNTCPSSCPNW